MIKTDTKISVVIPTYNSSLTIVNTIESIVNSLKNDFEIIIVDDCSSDNTVNIIKNLELNNTIKIINLNENSGPGVARDEGLKQAKGEYTIFFDSDDLMLPDAIDNALTILDDKDIDIAIFPYKINFMNGTTIDMWDRDRYIIEQIITNVGHYPTIENNQELLTITNYPWNKICKTSFLLDHNIRFGNLRLHEDIIPHWLILMNSREIYLAKDNICEYMLSSTGNNVTNDSGEKRLLSVSACKELFNIMNSNEKYSKFINMYWIFSANLLTWARDMIDEKYKKKVINLSYELFQNIKFLNLIQIYKIDNNAFNSIHFFLIERN